MTCPAMVRPASSDFWKAPSERIGGFVKSPFFEPVNRDGHKLLFQFDDAVNNGFGLYAVLSQDVPLQQKFSPSMDKPKTFSINQQPEGKKGKHFLNLAMYVYKRTVHPFIGCYRIAKAGSYTGGSNSRYEGMV